MNNVYYNGIVVYSFTVEVKSVNHKTCLEISKRIKDYLSAWGFSCYYPSESKSARKGEVLTRNIQSKFEDYPSTVMFFREGLRCICFHYDLYTKDTSVIIFDHGTMPKDIEIY